MKRPVSLFVFTTITWCFASVTMAPAAVVNLTGLIEFATDINGAATGDAFNTLGGDGIDNLYVTDGGVGGAFINADDDAATRIDLPLWEGTYTYHIFGQDLISDTHYGLNLFFNDDDSTPRISVFALLDTPPSPPYEAFTVNADLSTVELDGTSAAAANSLFYTTGGYTVTLTDYRWSDPTVEALDRVSTNDDVADLQLDYVGSFVLSVVPEPASVHLVGCGALALLTLRRRRRSGVSSRRS